VADAYDPMAVYRIAAEVGCWDCDDTVVCDCGKSWSVYYNPASDAEVIRRLRNHASCPYARRRRAGGHGTDPAPPPTGLVGRPSKPQAAVTSWRTFCTCPEPDLDDADRCRKCGTQWRQ